MTYDEKKREGHFSQNTYIKIHPTPSKQDIQSKCKVGQNHLNLGTSKNLQGRRQKIVQMTKQERLFLGYLIRTAPSPLAASYCITQATRWEPFCTMPQVAYSLPNGGKQI